MTRHLLPDNRTAFQTALSEALDFLPALLPEVDMVRGIKLRHPFPQWLGPALVYEYALGDIEAYFETADALVAEGIAWQRVIGTPAALLRAFGWLGYGGAAIDDARPLRRMWHRYQCEMGETPAVELPVLANAEYLARLSEPARSVFFRGWHGYDVPAIEWSAGRWSGSIWGDASGVRLPGGSVKWSHGESYSGTIVAGENERQALGVDVAEGDPIGWDDIPWDAPGISWEGVVDVAAFKSFLIRRLPVYVGFYEANGDAIGFRRPIAIRDVSDDEDGDTVRITVECRTGFGDGVDAAAAWCSLVFRAGNGDPAKPGKLWLDPDDIAFEDGVDEADMTIGTAPLDFTFRRTVRQHVTLTLEI